MDKEHVRITKLAHLSRITIPEDQEKVMIDRLQFMIDWVNKLNEIDLENIEPLRVMTFEKEVIRKDTPNNSMDIKQALKVAPSTDGNHFIVPKVIK